MSPRLPRISGKETVRALGRVGFVQVSQRGSHVKLRNAAKTVIVPMHPELAYGTLASVLRQAGMSADEFLKLL